MSEAPVTQNSLVLECADRIAAMAPGSLITHLLMAEMLRLNLKNPRELGAYYQAMAKLKRELQRKHHAFLTVVPSKGYKLQEIGKEIDVCEDGFRRGVRKIGQAVQATNNINLHRMTANVRNETVHRIQSLANVYGMLMNGAPKRGQLIAEQ